MVCIYIGTKSKPNLQLFATVHTCVEQFQVTTMELFFLSATSTLTYHFLSHQIIFQFMILFSIWSIRSSKIHWIRLV